MQHSLTQLIIIAFNKFIHISEKKDSPFLLFYDPGGSMCNGELE